MKLLPINPDPYIRVFTHHAFIDAIVNNAWLPLCGCKHASSMPDISQSIICVLYNISRMPCTVSSRCNGCSCDSFEVEMIRSLTTGLYFIVQVP